MAKARSKRVGDYLTGERAAYLIRKRDADYAANRGAQTDAAAEARTVGEGHGAVDRDAWAGAAVTSLRHANARRAPSRRLDRP